MRFRFSVRMILVGVGLIAVCLGWTANRLRVARQNERTIEELRGMMALATLDDGTAPPPSHSPGIEAVFNARQVSSVRNVTSDNVLAKLSTLRRLRRVDIAGPVTDRGLANLRNTTSLEELRITSDQITNSGLTQLSRLLNLEVLEISGKALSDDCLPWVKKLTKLKELRLTGHGFTDAGMEQIADLREIRDLSLSGALVSNEGLKKLGGLTNLEHVDLTRTKATMGGLAHLVMDLQRREFGEWFPAQVIRETGRLYVGLSGTQCQDDVVPYLLKGVPDITELELDATGITDKGLTALGGFTKLKHLALREMTAVSAIEGLPQIERLSLIGLGAKPVPDLRKMPKLQAIAFTGVQWGVAASQTDEPFAGNGLAKVAEFGKETPSLQTLILDGSAVTDGHVAQLMSMDLKRLDIGVTKISDESLKLCSRMPSLESLQIRGNKVTDAGILELTALKRLRYLGLSWNPGITDTAIAALKNLASLQELGLVDTGVTKAGYDELQEALPNCDIRF